MPSRQRTTNNETVLANAPQPEERKHQRRPYLLKMLQRGLGTRVLADTLDWDGECLHFLSRAGRRPWYESFLIISGGELEVYCICCENLISLS